MKGRIHRVTYNVGKSQAELHMEDGSIEVCPMSYDEWNEILFSGKDLQKDFERILDEVHNSRQGGVR